MSQHLIVGPAGYVGDFTDFTSEQADRAIMAVNAFAGCPSLPAGSVIRLLGLVIETVNEAVTSDGCHICGEDWTGQSSDDNASWHDSGCPAPELLKLLDEIDAALPGGLMTALR